MEANNHEEIEKETHKKVDREVDIRQLICIQHINICTSITESLTSSIS